MEPVTSRNQRVVEAARLHRARERRETGRSLIEGPNLLAEAIAGGVLPRVIFALAGDEPSAALANLHGVTLVRVDEGALLRLAGTRTPRGPVAVFDVPGTVASLADPPGVLVSWGVGDPGNVGTLIRTAAAFGWGFAHTPGTADPWSPKVLRAGAGAQFRAHPVPITELRDLETAGLVPVATVVEGGAPPDSLPGGRYAVLIGEEAAGLPDDVAAAASKRLTIPMPGGSESLNAAVAAAIVVYELSRRRVTDTGVPSPSTVSGSERSNLPPSWIS